VTQSYAAGDKVWLLSAWRPGEVGGEIDWGVVLGSENDREYLVRIGDTKYTAWIRGSKLAPVMS
jgi:hypothetical protein